jgi:hypothetical protein
MRKIYLWSEERSKGTLNAFNLWKLKSLPPEKKAIKKRNYVMLLRKGCQITTPAYSYDDSDEDVQDEGVNWASVTPLKDMDFPHENDDDVIDDSNNGNDGNKDYDHEE